MITCAFEDGGKAGLRHVTVGAIVVNDKNEVLLEKRAPHLLNGGKYTVPGGFLDRDEDTKAAVLRELYEETGYRGKIECLFRINDSAKRPKEDRQNVDFVYVVTVKPDSFVENKEVTEIAWFTKDTLPTEEEFAFDHREAILWYFEYLEKKFPLPILGKPNEQ